MSNAITLSIIVPTFNEQDNLAQLLHSLPLDEQGLEVVVVDAYSSDNTIEVAQNFGIRTLQCSPSRGHQLALGVEKTHGDNLWFLHADSVINEQHISAIEDALIHDPNIIGGNFAITFNAKDPFSLWLNRFYSAIRKRGIYYGDSGIFIRRSALALLGGFPERALMEDYTLVRRMERSKYPTICIEEPHIVSSSRRFKGRSKSNIILGWIIIHVMFYLRISDKYLAKTYNSLRN